MRQPVGKRGLWEADHTHYSRQYGYKCGKNRLNTRLAPYWGAYCERQFTNDALTDNLVSDSVVFVAVDRRQFSDRRSSSAQFSSEKRPRNRVFQN